MSLLKRIWLIGLLALIGIICEVFPVAASAPLTTAIRGIIAYDGVKRAGIGYDKPGFHSSSLATAYDTTLVCSADENGNYSGANHGLIVKFAKFLAAKGVEGLNPAAIRFSQSSVSGVEEIAASMRANGWQGAPIDVVRMSDGALTTFDNTRVLAASRAVIDVQAVVGGAGEAFPAGRWTPRSGIQPTTWEQAVQARIQQQNRLFRQTYPNGSPITGSAQ